MKSGRILVEAAINAELKVPFLSISDRKATAVETKTGEIQVRIPEFCGRRVSSGDLELVR